MGNQGFRNVEKIQIDIDQYFLKINNEISE
jgi:hypothetical protein